MLIDDFSQAGLRSALGTRWRGVSDQVMGGISEAAVRRSEIDGRICLRLSGDVRLENDGGFIQASLDLAQGAQNLDASAFDGISLLVRGNGENYGLHLRTPDNRLPWQSYRAQFRADPAWQELKLPFSDFLLHRLEVPLDRSSLRRLGLVAIGRAFHADLAVARIALYRY